MIRPRKFSDLFIFKNKYGRLHINKSKWTLEQLKKEYADYVFSNYSTFMEYYTRDEFYFLIPIEEAAAEWLWLKGEISDEDYPNAKFFYNNWHFHYVNVERCRAMGCRSPFE